MSFRWASLLTKNALTLAMAIELKADKIPVDAVSPGFTKTKINGFAGTDTVEESAAEAVRLSLLPPRGAHRYLHSCYFWEPHLGDFYKDGGGKGNGCGDPH